MNYDFIKTATRLQEVDKEMILEKTAKAQFPGSNCAFRVVANMLPNIRNSYALLLGPEICLYNAKLGSSLFSLTDMPLPNNLLFLLFSIEDITFGVSEKIKEAILDICSHYNPEVLFVVTTCLQEIIGEDFDSLIDETAKEVTIPLIGIHTENFTCESSTPGVENTFLSLINLMEKQETEKGTVNIFGLHSHPSYKNEIVSLLKSKGVVIKNIFPAFCTPDELQKAPAAEVNLVFGRPSLPLAQEMKARFGCDYVYCEKPYTPDAIEEMYMTIAKALDIDIQDEVRKMKNSSVQKLSEMKELFFGKTCVTGGSHADRGFNYVQLLLELGVEIVGMVNSEIFESDLNDIEKLKSMGIDFPIIHAGNAVQTEIFLEQLKPDYFMGFGDMEFLARMEIEPKNAMAAHWLIGFSALNEVLDLLSKKRAGFNTLLYKEQYIKTWEAAN